MKPYRKYLAQSQWVDETTKQVRSISRVFNLFEIDSYAECDLENDGFKYGQSRTIITTSMNMHYTILVPFAEFDEAFTEAMNDARLLDDRSFKKKDDPIPFEAKWKYRGGIKYHFKEVCGLIASSVFPDNYDPHDKPMESRMSNCIDTGFVYFN